MRANRKHHRWTWTGLDMIHKILISAIPVLTKCRNKTKKKQQQDILSPVGRVMRNQRHNIFIFQHLLLFSTSCFSALLAFQQNCAFRQFYVQPRLRDRSCFSLIQDKPCFDHVFSKKVANAGNFSRRVDEINLSSILRSSWAARGMVWKQAYCVH